MAAPDSPEERAPDEDIVTLKDFKNESVIGYRISNCSTEGEKEMSYFKTQRRSRTTVLVVDATSKLAGSIDYHLLDKLWASCLAAAGLLDILAYVLPDFVMSSAVEAASDDAAAPETTVADPFADNDSFPPLFLEFVRWLDEHEHGIFLFFSSLWFVNASLAAHNRHRRDVIKEERRILVGMGDEANFRKTPSIAYYGSLALQFLLLPVGFYFVVFHAVTNMYRGEHTEVVDNVGENLAVCVTNLEYVAKLGEFSPETKVSLIGAISNHFSRSLLRAFNAQIQLTTKSAKSMAVKKLIGKAIRHPIQFRKKLKDFLTKVRWIKYLAPLVGAGNKLLKNTLVVLKRWKLRAHAKRVKIARKLLWEKKKKGKLTEASAAIVIQTAFRAYWARKVKRCLLLMQFGRESQAVLRVQRKLREKLKETRKRLAAKRRELEQLKRMRKKNSDLMSTEDKKTMDQLQDELGREARKLLNRRLLLRPTTKFAVYWKIFFVVAVLCEMTHKAAKPLIDGLKRKKGDAPMTMEELVAKTFVPTRLSDFRACQGNKKKADERNREAIPWYCLEPIVTWQGGFRDLVALVLVPAPVSEWPECQGKKRKNIDRKKHGRRGERCPWYCLGPHPAWHAIYRRIVALALTQFRYFLGNVMFLDVFVTFFTGRFDERTGALVPTPWFQRWVAPGLALQLIVNPNVATISNAARRCIRTMAEIGPYRTYQYAVAVILPVSYGAASLIVEYLWLPLVHYENTARVISSPFLE